MAPAPTAVTPGPRWRTYDAFARGTYATNARAYAARTYATGTWWTDDLKPGTSRSARWASAGATDHPQPR